MLTVYQLDKKNLLMGDPPYSRQAPTKGHLQVLVQPPAAPAGHIQRWLTELDPVADTKLFGTPGTGDWEIVEDHQKATLWIEHGKQYKLEEDHEGQAYDGIGPVPAWLHTDEPAAPEPTLEDLRASKQQAATDKRWEVMTGGMVLPSGIAVGTTIDDQNRITSVVANAELAGLTDADEVDFKAASGWVRVSIEQVKAIAGAIGQFVQACYTAERAHHDAIDRLENRADLDSYDVDTGWPSGSEA